MPHQHTEKVETVDSAEFAGFDLVGAYNDVRDEYPIFTDGDEGRQKALEWAIAELKLLSRADNHEGVQSPSAREKSTTRTYCIDIGCAHGRPVVQTFAEQGFEVTGIDLCDGLLEQAKQTLAHLPNASLDLADVRLWEPSPARRDGNVDCITTFYAMNHLPLADYEPVIARMVGWLKPRTGLLVLATVAQIHGWVTIREATFPSTSLTIQQNTTLLERNGCEVIKAWEEEWSSKHIHTEVSRTNQFICARKK